MSSSEFRFKIFYGEYQLRSCGLDFIRTWHHNSFLSLSRAEQYKLNSQNYDDFSELETQKGCGTIITG